MHRRLVGGLAADGARSAAEGSWQALEARLATQVRRDAEQLDAERLEADRVLRASLTRLDSRVHCLETQGVRAERRAAELANLTQAVQEEQRTLTLRFERLEEQVRRELVRDGRAHQREQLTPGSAEDIQSRLYHLERELRAVSLNMKLVFSHVEESQQRQHQRLTASEEHFRQLRLSRGVDDGLAPATPPAPPPPPPRAPLGPGSSPAPLAVGRNSYPSGKADAGNIDLIYAEQRATQSLRAAEDLQRRFEYGDAPAPGAAWRPTAPGGSGSTIEARLDALSEGLDELHSRIHAVPTKEQVVKLISSLRSPVTAVADGAPLEELRGRIGELRAQLGAGPSHDDILAYTAGGLPSQQVVLLEEIKRKLEAVDRAAFEHSRAMPSLDDFKQRLEAVERAAPEYSPMVMMMEDFKQRLESVERASAEPGHSVVMLEECKRRLELVEQAAPEQSQTAARLDIHEASLADLRARLDLVPRWDSTAHAAHVKRLEELHGKVDTFDGQAAQIADLWGKLEQVPTHEHLLATCTNTVEAHSQLHSEALRSHEERIHQRFLELHGKLEGLPTHDDVRSIYDGQRLPEALGETDRLAELHAALSTACRSELAAHQEALKGSSEARLSAIQAAVDGLRRDFEGLLEGEGSLLLALGRLRATDGTASAAPMHAEPLAPPDAANQPPGCLQNLLKACGGSGGHASHGNSPRGGRSSRRESPRPVRAEPLAGDAASTPAEKAAAYELSALMEELQMRIRTILGSDAPGVSAGGLQELAAQLRAELAEEIGMMREQISRLPTPDQMAGLSAEIQELLANWAVRGEAGTSGEPLAVLWGSAREVGGEVQQLRRQCDELKDAVDDKVPVWLKEVERKAGEALEKADRLLREYSQDLCAKVEEHESRLGLILVRMGTQDQHYRDCMGRVDKLPTATHVRALLHEELRKHLDEVSQGGVERQVTNTLAAVECLRDQLNQQAIDFEHLTRRVSAEQQIEVEGQRPQLAPPPLEAAAGPGANLANA